jgi:glycosyltransferase involved in cell wall biosynthesis
VHRFVVIRRRDARLLAERFSVPAGSVSFVHWPGDLARDAGETSDGGYVYAAGWAHRDWPMFLEAVKNVPIRVVIAADLDGRTHSPHGRAEVEIVGAVPPSEGRRLMRAATVVAVPLIDTDLAAGPLVLLDAMTAGKAVLATRTGGTVDYITDRVDGLLVAPGDPKAFAAALSELLSSPGLRAELGERARESAAAFSSEDFWRACYLAASG